MRKTYRLTNINLLKHGYCHIIGDSKTIFISFVLNTFGSILVSTFFDFFNSWIFRFVWISIV